jgi:hypothetical protein
MCGERARRSLETERLGYKQARYRVSETMMYEQSPPDHAHRAAEPI